MRQMGYFGWMVSALVLSGLGAFVKLLGAFEGSKAVFVDALTCFANLVAGVFVLASIYYAGRPPDYDHPYGHERLVYGGIVASIAAYSFVAGIAAYELSSLEPYTVSERAAVYALTGAMVYFLAVIVARRAFIAGAAYAGFTFSEVIEGVVTAATAYAGASLSYIIDYIGGVGLLAYIVYEVVEQSWHMVRMSSDMVHPETYRKVLEEFSKRGLEVSKLRLRMVVPGKYHGDAVVHIEPNMSYEVANVLIDEASEELRRRYNIDLAVHVDHVDESQKPRPNSLHRKETKER